MKHSSAILLFNLCTTLYAQGFETPLGSVYDSSLTCENGATPKVTCYDTSTHESSCSCRCTNGINIDRPFTFFLRGNGTAPRSPDNCEASKEQLEADARACAARGEDLSSQLNACTFRERDSASQAEACAVRERNTLDQLNACTARETELVQQLGTCTARERDSLTRLDASTARENDLISQLAVCKASENQEKILRDQLEASQKQVATHAQTIASNTQTITQLRARVNTLESSCVRYKYLGCYTDSATRALNGPSKVGDPSMTTEKCSAFCKDYTWFGTEAGQECYCGNTFASYITRGDECATVCKGSNTQICGGGWRLSAYQNVVN